MTAAGWVALAAAILAAVAYAVSSTRSVAAFSVLLGRRDSELDRAREDITTLKAEIVASRTANAEQLQQARDDIEAHRDELIESREAVQREIANFLRDLKELSSRQAEINMYVARTLDAVTVRLQQIGDLTIQHGAVVDMHTEVLRSKGLIGG